MDEKCRPYRLPTYNSKIYRRQNIFAATLSKRPLQFLCSFICKHLVAILQEKLLLRNVLLVVALKLINQTRSFF
jgi:hypothetical protein